QRRSAIQNACVGKSECASAPEARYPQMRRPHHLHTRSSREFSSPHFRKIGSQRSFIPPGTRAFIQTNRHRLKPFAIAKLLPKVLRSVFSRPFPPPHPVEPAIR